MTRSATLLAILAPLAPLALAACAAAPPPAASPEAPPPAVFQPGARAVSPLDQEMLAIGHAEEEIDRAFPEVRVQGGPRKGGKAGPGPADAGKGGGERDILKDKEEQRGAGVTAGAGSPGEPCAIACRALSSMVSSAERLCRLSGENDGRCDDARARVRGATARVKSSCPGCTVSPPASAPAGPPKGTPAADPNKPPSPAPGMPGSSSTQPIP
jgi:hypothetical protein